MFVTPTHDNFFQVGALTLSRHRLDIIMLIIRSGRNGRVAQQGQNRQGGQQDAPHVLESIKCN